MTESTKEEIYSVGQTIIDLALAVLFIIFAFGTLWPDLTKFVFSHIGINMSDKNMLIGRVISFFLAVILFAINYKRRKNWIDNDPSFEG
jgi:amino acid permease